MILPVQKFDKRDAEEIRDLAKTVSDKVISLTPLDRAAVSPAIIEKNKLIRSIIQTWGPILEGTKPTYMTTTLNFNKYKKMLQNYVAFSPGRVNEWVVSPFAPLAIFDQDIYKKYVSSGGTKLPNFPTLPRAAIQALYETKFNYPDIGLVNRGVVTLNDLILLFRNHPTALSALKKKGFVIKKDYAGAIMGFIDKISPRMSLSHIATQASTTQPKLRDIHRQLDALRSAAENYISMLGTGDQKLIRTAAKTLADHINQIASIEIATLFPNATLLEYIGDKTTFADLMQRKQIKQFFKDMRDKVLTQNADKSLLNHLEKMINYIDQLSQVPDEIYHSRRDIPNLGPVSISIYKSSQGKPMIVVDSKYGQMTFSPEELAREMALRSAKATLNVGRKNRPPRRHP